MKPKKGKYYFINYVDHEDPRGSFDGIAECIGEHLKDAKGRYLKDPFYEFVHKDAEGNMVASLFTASEVILEAK